MVSINNPSTEMQRRAKLSIGLAAVCLYFVFYTLTMTPSLSVRKSLGTLQEYTETNDAGLKRILHGTITQKLENGQLPIGPSNKTYSPWKDDPPESSCVNYTTRLGVDLQVVRLVSYPCSGNTWVRYLLEATTGIFTGSVYTDPSLLKGGFLGESNGPNSRRTIVQKTHLSTLPKSDINNYYRRYHLTTPYHPAVLVIRNPAKALISYWKFLRGGSHLRQVSEVEFDTDDFHNHVNSGIALWENLIMDRLLWSTAPVFILHYEDLLVDPATNLRNVLRFLGVPLDEGRLSCVLSHLSGNFKRQGNTDLNPYNRQEMKLLAASITKINQTLQILDYQPLPCYT